MTQPALSAGVERLFPFVMRSRNLIVGGAALLRSKSRLHFVLITDDLSENGRAEVLAGFRYYPVVQHYKSEELERFFGVKGARIVGFKKSGLAQSIYAELRQFRINQPLTPQAKTQEKPASKAHRQPGLPGRH
jgi:hypothetical protein